MFINYKNMKAEIEKLAPELASFSNWDSKTLSAAHKGMSKVNAKIDIHLLEQNILCQILDQIADGSCTSNNSNFIY